MPKLLTPQEIAECLKVEESTVYEWLRSGFLVGFKIGRLWRIDAEVFTSWLTKQQEDSDKN